MTVVILLHNIAVSLIILMAALGFGIMMTKHVLKSQINDDLTVLWISEIIGLGFISIITLILGLVGLLNETLFIVLILIFATLGIYWGAKHFDLNIQSRLSLVSENEKIVLLLVIIITSSLFWIFLTHSLMPPHEWDEIAYHLALSKIYVQDGNIQYIPSIVTSNWPLNHTMLFSIALIFGADIAPHLLMLAMTILILFGLVYFGKNFSDVYVGLLAATLFITIPLTKRLAGTGLIDVSMGLYGIAAIVCLELWRSNNKKFWLICCGLNTGFMAGTKLTGIALIMIIAIMVLKDSLSVGQSNTKKLIQNLTIFGFSAVMVVLPWFVRSFIFTNNPIYPFAYSIFDGLNWDALGDEYHSTMQMALFSPKLPRNLPGLLKTLEFILIQPHVLGGYTGGLGIILPISFIMSFFIIGDSPRWIKSNIFVVVCFFLAWFLFASLHLRYLLPIVPLMAWTSSYSIIHLYRKISRRQVRILIIIVLSIFILFDWPWIKTNEMGLFLKRLPYISGQITREQWLESQLDIYPVFDYSNNHLPEGSKILLLPFENRGFYLDLSYYWGHPFSQRLIKFEEYQSPVILANRLVEMGFTHIIDNPNWVNVNYRFWEHDRAIMLELEKQCGEELFQENNITLYKLVKCSSNKTTKRILPEKFYANPLVILNRSVFVDSFLSIQVKKESKHLFGYDFTN